jgi:hypothetical protein
MTKQTTIRRPRKMAREPQTDALSAQVPTERHGTAKAPTKASLLEALLLKGEGASLADLCQATSWLPRTCRAFLSGLRKKGRVLDRGKRQDGTTIYRLVSSGTAG